MASRKEHRARPTGVKPIFRRDVQLIDAEGFLVQIPFEELKRFRVSRKKKWNVPVADDGGTDGGTPSRQTCEETSDTGMMGCSG
jgi:hypothetical protein